MLSCCTLLLKLILMDWMCTWRLLRGGWLFIMAGMESMELYQPLGNHMFETISLTPFQPFLWAVLPSAASTSVHSLLKINNPSQTNYAKVLCVSLEFKQDVKWCKGRYYVLFSQRLEVAFTWFCAAFILSGNSRMAVYIQCIQKYSDTLTLSTFC